MDPLPIKRHFCGSSTYKLLILILLMDPFPITSGEAGGYSGSPQRGETYIRVIFGPSMDPLPITPRRSRVVIQDSSEFF